MRILHLLGAAVLAGALTAPAQQTAQPLPQPNETRQRKDEGIYGKIKEVEGKRKIVIAIDNAPDKTYDLADSKTVVDVAEGLGVGDPVRVLETERDGRKTVRIVRNTQNSGR